MQFVRNICYYLTVYLHRQCCVLCTDLCVHTVDDLHCLKIFLIANCTDKCHGMLMKYLKYIVLYMVCMLRRGSQIVLLLTSIFNQCKSRLWVSSTSWVETSNSSQELFMFFNYWEHSDFSHISINCDSRTVPSSKALSLTCLEKHMVDAVSHKCLPNAHVHVHR